MNNKWLSVGVILMLAAVLAGCGKCNRTKYLVMGTDAEFPPFESRDNGEVVGFDVEVARVIAAKVGLPLKIADMDFERLLPTLAAGEVDMVLAGLTITPERAQTVDFSVPYYKAKQVALVLKGGAIPKTKEDLRGRKLAALVGSTGDEVATELTGEKKVRQCTSTMEAVVSLMNSRVYAVIIDEQPARLFAKKNPELKLVDLDFEDEFYGVAIQKGNTELRAKIDEALLEIVADGRYEQFVDDWMVRMSSPRDEEE